MKGNIFIILCKMASGRVDIYAVHETYEGAKEETDVLYDYYNSHNFIAKAGINGKLAVFTKDGRPHREYIINNYPLDK